MAAKVIQVSDDNGVNWHTLPGATGSFMTEADSITDTIFGDTFESHEIGLLGWTVSANAYFKGYAGYLAEIKQIGTATSFSSESMTLRSGKIYDIDDTTKSIWQRTSGSFAVTDGSGDVTDEVEWVDYLFGAIKFLDSYTPTGSVTVDGHYYPTSQLGKGQSFTLTMTANAIDNTDFATAQGNGGYKTFEPGLRIVQLELGGIFDATVNSKSDLAARNELIVEIDPAGDGLSIARGFFKMMSTEQSGDVGALEEESLSLELTVPLEETNPGVYIPFSWLHDATTKLAQAVQICLQSWIDQTLIDVRYLPQGSAGQSPLDGISGDCIVTDVSLSGGLSDMNTFVADFQGSGAYTEV